MTRFRRRPIGVRRLVPRGETTILIPSRVSNGKLFEILLESPEVAAMAIEADRPGMVAFDDVQD